MTTNNDTFKGWSNYVTCEASSVAIQGMTSSNLPAVATNLKSAAVSEIYKERDMNIRMQAMVSLREVNWQEIAQAINEAYNN
jgi:uncharacterized protein YqgV (UPF0045/DUF77 family)